MENRLTFYSTFYKVGKSAKSIKKADAYDEISKELKRLEKVNAHEISDIWHGATKKKVEGYFGHTQAGYWNDSASLPKESFAHMFCATIHNPEALIQIQRYFPRSYKVFEEMIKEFVKGLV